MPEVRFVVVSRQAMMAPGNAGAGTSPSPEIIIVSPWLALKPHHIPSAFSFSITIGMTSVPREGGDLTVLVASPSGHVVFTAGPIRMQPPTSVDGIQSDEAHAVAVLNVQNIDLTEEGVFHVRVLFNEGLLVDQELLVRRVEETGGVMQ